MHKSIAFTLALLITLSAIGCNRSNPRQSAPAPVRYELEKFTGHWYNFQYGRDEMRVLHICFLRIDTLTSAPSNFIFANQDGAYFARIADRLNDDYLIDIFLGDGWVKYSSDAFSYSPYSDRPTIHWKLSDYVRDDRVACEECQTRITEMLQTFSKPKSTSENSSPPIN